MRLKDKVALVTGASGGLGAGICEAFAREGAHCIAVYHSDKKGGEDTAARVRELGREALAVQADIGDEAQVREMVQAADRTFGRLDILAANAGYGLAKPLLLHQRMPKEPQVFGTLRMQVQMLAAKGLCHIGLAGLQGLNGLANRWVRI